MGRVISSCTQRTPAPPVLTKTSPNSVLRPMNQDSPPFPRKLKHVAFKKCTSYKFKVIIVSLFAETTQKSPHEVTFH